MNFREFNKEQKRIEKSIAQMQARTELLIKYKNLIYLILFFIMAITWYHIIFK